MLPGNCNSNRFWLSFFVKDQVRYLIAKNGLAHDVSLGISDCMQCAIESLKSVRRLAGELHFINVVFKIINKAQRVKLTFRIFSELDGFGNVGKFGIFFFFGQIKRFESLNE